MSVSKTGTSKDTAVQKLLPLPERLAKIGLVKDWDFVLHLPLRYEDETSITPIAQMRPGQPGQILATVLSQQVLNTARGQQFLATVSDGSAVLTLRFFHFYPSIKQQLHVDAEVRLYGEVRPAFNGGLEMIHPRVKSGKVARSELPKAMTPIYPAGEGIQQRWLRKRIDRALLDMVIKDPLPDDIRERYGLPELHQAIEYLHHPPQGADLQEMQNRTSPAWRRLIFDELLAQQITLRSTRAMNAHLRAPRLTGDKQPDLIKRFIDQLPFTLTGAQARVWQEVLADLKSDNPMNRLVQGDVGCGKTVIAALAALQAISSGQQAALMAPTEILAEQHFRKLEQWLSPLGLEIVWISGKMPAAQKREALQKIASGQAQLTVGTHALIQDGVTFKAPGLSIVDEQHRFGVAQRLSLRAHGENHPIPHLLMLSATPIPRTLAMSYLADLNVSVIDELPPGRTPIATRLVAQARKDDVIRAVGATVALGQQVYWVCPLIEESETLDLTPATACHAELQLKLPDLTVGLIHGAMAPAEKDVVMKEFQAGIIDVLVATTVIEVGVDVPNATLMVIEHAERFGLAQLHQLRGRVGRGSGKSSCVLLFGQELSDNGRERLKIIRENTDGFEIARRDLELRGPGEFLGERQSGMPLLRFSDLDRDQALLAAATRTAGQWLKSDPQAAVEHARRWFDQPAEFLTA